MTGCRKSPEQILKGRGTDPEHTNASRWQGRLVAALFAETIFKGSGSVAGRLRPGSGRLRPLPPPAAASRPPQNPETFRGAPVPMDRYCGYKIDVANTIFLCNPYHPDHPAPKYKPAHMHLLEA